MTQIAKNFKKISTLKMPGTGKLIALAILEHDTLDVKRLVEITGETVRVVQMYRAMYLTVQAESETCETYESREADFAKDAKVAKPISCDDHGTVEPHIEEHARLKETPTELSSSKEDIPPSPQEPRDGRKRGSRLPDDWKLPDDWRQWVKVNCPMVNDGAITKEADIFRDYWIAKPGAQACKLDWEATWRNWCRKAFSPAGQHQGVKQPARTGVFRSAPIVSLATPNAPTVDPAEVRRLVEQSVRGYA